MRVRSVNRLVLLAGLVCGTRALEAQVATESVRQRSSRGAKLRVALVPVDESRVAATTKPLIQAKFEEALLRASRFAVMTRTEMDALRAEQRLAASGAVDPASAARLGRMLSVDYVVVARHLDFSEREMSIVGGLRNVFSSTVGKSRTLFDIGIQVQAIDVETGEIVASRTFDDTVSGPGGSLVTVTPARGNTPGKRIDPTPQQILASPGGAAAYGAALARFGDAFAAQLAGSLPLEAVVVLVRDAENIAINLGLSAGVAIGTKFDLVAEGPAITDPSGAILGYDDRIIGQAQVVRVEDRLTWLKLLSTLSSSGAPDSTPDLSKVTRNMAARTTKSVPK